MSTQNHTDRAHAPMSASRMSRIMACPASFKLENSMPYVPAGAAAERGTYIHEMAEKILEGDLFSYPAADVDPEDLKIATDYAKYVEELRANARSSHIELNVNEGLQQLHPAFGGTADAVVIKNNTLHVVDLKTGRIPVKAEENEQLLTYALGVAQQLKAPPHVAVELHIWQPGNVSRWSTTMERLRKHGTDMVAAAKLAEGEPVPSPSADACRYCKAKAICPAMREKVQDTARKEFGLVDETVSTVSAVITPEMLDEAERAISWAEAVQAAAKEQLKAGTAIQGWGLKPGRKMRSWADEAKALEMLADNKNAWTLKSVASIAKLGVDLTGLVEEKLSEPSLARSK
jgi:Protein of unknown function (DUF2800)